MGDGRTQEIDGRRKIVGNFFRSRRPFIIAAEDQALYNTDKEEAKVQTRDGKGNQG